MAALSASRCEKGLERAAGDGMTRTVEREWRDYSVLEVWEDGSERTGRERGGGGGEGGFWLGNGLSTYGGTVRACGVVHRYLFLSGPGRVRSALARQAAEYRATGGL